MKKIKVDSISTLEQELLADSWHEDLGRYRTRNVFRGLPDSTYRLTTTLQRLGVELLDNTKIGALSEKINEIIEIINE